jgi:hypothetical protein
MGTHLTPPPLRARRQLVVVLALTALFRRAAADAPVAPRRCIRL